jgi:hypothetical protein
MFCRINQGSRERHKMERPGYSFERPGRRVFRWITLRLEFESIFRCVCPNWDKVRLLSVAQVVAQLAEGCALSGDAAIQRLR